MRTVPNMLPPAFSAHEKIISVIRIRTLVISTQQFSSYIPPNLNYGLRIHVTPSTISATAPTKMMTPVGKTILSRIPTPRKIAQSPPDLPPGPHRRNKNTSHAVLLSQSTQEVYFLCLILITANQKADALSYFNGTRHARFQLIADTQRRPSV